MPTIKTTFQSLTLILAFTVLLSCKSKESQVEPPEEATVLVQLVNAADVIKLEQEYTQYELKQKKVVSRPMNIFLYTFNANKITDVALVKELKTSALVKEAQQNKNVSTRN